MEDSFTIEIVELFFYADAAVTMYSETEPYAVTDCFMTLLTSLMERYAEYSLGEIVTPAGENVKGEKYYEYHLDQESLDVLVLEWFYKEK